jgi:hypothetical protein
MSRQHVSKYQRPADPYAYARCACGHFVTAGEKPGKKCQYSIEGCKCVDHRVKEVAGHE